MAERGQLWHYTYDDAQPTVSAATAATTAATPLSAASAGSPEAVGAATVPQSIRRPPPPPPRKRAPPPPPPRNRPPATANSEAAASAPGDSPPVTPLSALVAQSPEPAFTPSFTAPSGILLVRCSDRTDATPPPVVDRGSTTDHVSPRFVPLNFFYFIFLCLCCPFVSRTPCRSTA